MQELHPTRMFVPFMISLEDQVLGFKTSIKYGEDIDVSVIVLEILNNIFYDKVGRYGMYSGPLGAYKVMLPASIDDSVINEANALIHELQTDIVDVLGELFPTISMTPKDYYFYYPCGETTVIIYVPVTSDLPPELSAKAVPEQAIRHSVR